MLKSLAILRGKPTAQVATSYHRRQQPTLAGAPSHSACLVHPGRSDGSIIFERVKISKTSPALSELTPNGDPISYQEVTREIPALGKAFADARKTALEKLIDRKLLIQAARKGGQLPATFIDERIREIVDQQFHGDKAAFEAELGKQGYTVEKFREFQEETMLVQVMRQMIAHGETNPVAKDQQIATWLANAREKAQITYP